MMRNELCMRVILPHMIVMPIQTDTEIGILDVEIYTCNFISDNEKPFPVEYHHCYHLLIYGIYTVTTFVIYF